MKKNKNKYVGSSPFKILPLVGLGVGLLGSGIKFFGGRKRRKEAEAKQREYEREAARQRAEFEKQLDIYKAEEYVNPYENMQNVYADMTIDQRAEEFRQQATAQSQADIMERATRGVTSGAGAAALATAMARTGAQQARQTAAIIGKQEQDIQRRQLAEQARIQGLNIAGEEQVRQMERQRTMTLAQIASGQGQAALQGAQAFEQQAAQFGQMQNQALLGGITDIAAGFLPGGALSGVFGSSQTPMVATPQNTEGVLVADQNPLQGLGTTQFNIDTDFTD